MRVENTDLVRLQPSCLTSQSETETQSVCWAASLASITRWRAGIRLDFL